MNKVIACEKPELSDVFLRDEYLDTMTSELLKYFEFRFDDPERAKFHYNNYVELHYTVIAIDFIDEVLKGRNRDE